MSVHSIRVRLTAWYALVLAVALVAAGAVTYVEARRQIARAADADVVAATKTFIAQLADEADEGHGVLRVRSANEVLAAYRDDDRGMVLLTSDGGQFAAHDTPPVRALDRAQLRRLVAARRFGFAGDHGSIRLYLAPARLGVQSFVIAVADSRAAQEQTLAALRDAMLATLPLALLVASAGGYFLARKSLAPVVRMAEKARAIGATNLSERVEVPDARDELSELAATLNDLLARLDRAFGEQRRFMADASHELRTPVAVLQGELDVTLSRSDRDTAEYRESMEVMQRAVRRLTRIVSDLFLLARSDAGDVPLRCERLYVNDVVAQTARAYRTLASEHGTSVVADACADELPVEGDEDLLQRMLGNLLENAIHHTRRGTEVRIRCRRDGEGARIEVEDGGSGIAPEHREQIFDRFFRADAARTGPGAGLGLPIARWIAEAHGGALWLEASGADGSVFAITLPLRRS